MLSKFRNIALAVISILVFSPWVVIAANFSGGGGGGSSGSPDFKNANGDTDYALVGTDHRLEINQGATSYLTDSILSTQGASLIPASTTMQNAATGNGNGASLNAQGYVTAIINIVSSVPMAGGTKVNFEATVDDVTWVGILAHQVGSAGTLASSTTADGDFRINTAAYKSVRARISDYSSGTTTIKGYVSPLAGQPTTVTLGPSTSVAGKVGIDQTTPGTTNAVQIVTGTTGGWLNYRITAQTNDNHDVINNGAGLLGGIQTFNNSVTVNYIRLYNLGTGFNGCASATGLLWKGEIPASATVGGFVVSFPPPGISFSTGLSICVTGALGDTDTTAATASAIIVDVQYH